MFDFDTNILPGGRGDPKIHGLDSLGTSSESGWDSNEDLGVPIVDGELFRWDGVEGDFPSLVLERDSGRADGVVDLRLSECERICDLELEDC